MSGTGDELVKNVLPWDQSQMRDFNKKKIPEPLVIVLLQERASKPHN